MKKSLLLFLSLTLLYSCGKEANNKNLDTLLNSDFYARGSKKKNFASEAMMTFDYKVLIDKSHLKKYYKKDHKKIYKMKVEKQIKHLFGSFKMNKYKGVPTLGKNQTIKIDFRNVDKKSLKDQVIIPYSYEGKALVEDKLKSKIKLVVPKNPDHIYSLAKGDKKLNPCTSKNYNSEGDFWYFWNINNKGCDLIKGKHYDLVSVRLKKIANTKVTYPEYKRLLQTDGNGKRTLPIYIFFGNSHEERRMSVNLRGVKYLKSNHKTLKSFLIKEGFKSPKKEKLSSASVLHTYRNFLKEQNIELVVNIFYGNTGLSERDSIEFHKLYKTAIETGSIVYYGGHSGLGGNLHTEYLADYVGKIRPPKNQYQIYYFDSCASYPYYNEMYFDKKIGGTNAEGRKDKKGTYNLDIVTNGLSSYFFRNKLTIRTLMKSVFEAVKGKNQRSWQNIVDEFHNSGMKKSSLKGAIISISGDEDNSTTPSEI